MKKGLIITVAGVASRFNKDLDEPCLKCLYHRGNHEESLLGMMLGFSGEFYKIFIVGGYKFEELKKYINEYHNDKSIELVYNENFESLGSLESLRLGIKAAEKSDIDELIFAEGDLFFDKGTFMEVINSDTDVITTNLDPLTADKAVAFYITDKNQVRYAFDSSHKNFFIDVPFKAIYNSGQIWKFKELTVLYKVNNDLTNDDCRGTNLLPIQRYYDNLKSQPQVIQFEKWFNCNTVKDYDSALNGLTKEIK